MRKTSLCIQGESFSGIERQPRRHLPDRPELRIPNAAAQTRIVSVARIRLDSRKSGRPFKGIFCDDVSEFESDMLSHAVRSLCAMVKLTYGRANRDKVSPPDTLTIAAQERRTPRGKSAPTQICWKPPTALPGGIVFANRNFVLSWGDLETPRVYHAARQRGLRVSLCKRGGARGILRSGS